MGTLSTTAWVLHDLGLAAGFGGPLFGEVALHKAVKSIQSEEERERVLDRAWKTYNVIDAACLGLAAFTWVVGRSRLTGREIDQQTHRLVLAKDVVIGAALGTGILQYVLGRRLHEHPPGTAVTDEVKDGPSQQVKAALRDPEKLKRMLQVLGPLHTALSGGALALTTVLAMRSGRSGRWSIISRFLP
jgi:hypothetical protein